MKHNDLNTALGFVTLPLHTVVWIGADTEIWTWKRPWIFIPVGKKTAYGETTLIWSHCTCCHHTLSVILQGQYSSTADLSSKWNKSSCKQHPSMFLLTNLPVKFSWHTSFSLFTQLCSLFLGWQRFRIWCDPRHSFGKYRIEIPMYIMTVCPKSAAFNRADS